ncbi:MAG: phosphotransferase family protein [Halobacteriales archaeon]
MTEQRTEFTPDSAGAYFQEQGVIPADATPRTRSLGGGVSNHVIEIRWGDNCLVAKQPLPNLAVEDDWPADVGRVHNEASAARAYADIIDAADLVARTPAVRYENETDHVIGLDCAPADALMWKRELLDGIVDTHVARTLGRLLGTVHARAAGDDRLRQQFEHDRPFDQLRIDPYHRTTAERHPDVADAIRAEIDRVTDVHRTLVHGDYSPKNVLLERNGGPVPWILDFEVAHWGDPAFDTAFMLNHLCIKSVFNHERNAAYLGAAEAFWTAYDTCVDWDIEADTVRELGVLMLARVDGKSPVEYVEEGPIADALRSVAKGALRQDLRTLERFRERIRTEVARL